jgi:DNA-binding NarL/FixJ family response regulator
MPLTILVVDDDLGTRLSVQDYLELYGFSVFTAQDGREALSLVERSHPNLIVTDISMPQMDGYELMRQVRRQPALRLLPVVFLTAFNQTEARIRGYQLGCDGYLAKPFELSELLAVIRNLLDRAQMITSEMQFVRHQTFQQEGAQSPVDPIALAAAIATHEALSQREQDVLKHLSDGLSNNQIGAKLHLSPRTIEKHVSSLLRKTDSNNRAELVRFALEHHLVN